MTDVVGGRYRALVILAAGTGLRQGEVFGLTLPRVDLLRRQLLVEQQLITVQGRAPFLAPSKTAASVRQVPLPGLVVDAVAAHLAQSEPGELGTVFSGESGEPLRRNRFSERVVASGCGSGPFETGDEVPRAPPLLRQPPDQPRRVGEDGAGPTGARQRHRDPRHRRPFVARFRRPDPRSRRLRSGSRGLAVSLGRSRWAKSPWSEP